MKKLLLITIMSVAYLTGIFAQDAVYVYRNDGDFNAYLTEEVDSILFITVPVDSMGNPDYPLYPDTTAYFAGRTRSAGNEVAMQVVYTPNEVHYIPMNAVDSISFVAPPVIFTDDVINMEENMWKHITRVNGMTLYFASSLPQQMVPARNKILLCASAECKLFAEGFVGRVTRVTTTADGYTVECATITDINDIFKQFIGVKKITESDENPQNVKKRAEGEIELGKLKVPLEAEIAIKDGDNSVSASGSINGNISGTLLYNISRKTQKVELRLSHDWQSMASLKAHIEGGYEKVSDGKRLFVKYFPSYLLRVFKFEITGHAFFAAEGSAEMSYNIKSPKYKYQTSYEYKNGEFTVNDKPIKASYSEGTGTQTFVNINLSGKLHTGGLARMSFGTVECFGSYVRGVADIYVGPELSGQFIFNTNTLDHPEYYDEIKDSRISLSLLSAYCKFTGEAKLGDDPADKAETEKMHIGTLFSKDWYLFPEFSNLTVKPEETYANVTCIAKRELLMPVTLGFELRDDGGSLGRWYEAKEYPGSANGLLFATNFDGLLNGKTYSIHPLVKFQDTPIHAQPEEIFTMPESTKPLCPDDHHPHVIDLGLPSGKKWSCCNIGADAPESYGGYYAWAELIEKDEYNWNNYAHWTPPVQEPGQPPIKVPFKTEIAHDIEGTEYDVAYMNWGNGWRMPTRADYKELQTSCVWKWTNYNGTNGMMVTGRDGVRLFIPAAGYSKINNIGTNGCYWYGTFLEEIGGTNKYFGFTEKDGHSTTKNMTTPYGLTVRPIKE